MKPKIKTPTERVEVSRSMMGICHMQVCAVPDATDEEILKVANSKNPAGTRGGWMKVLRKDKQANMNPIACEEFPGRMHFILEC